jgi:hypothetical protein
VLERRTLLSTISGQKFDDLNGNGVKDAGEGGLAGWTIYLDDNDNGTHDPGEPSAVTDQQGNYTFGDVAAGRHFVSEVLQDGWMQTLPANAGWAISLGNDFEQELGTALTLGDADDGVEQVSLTFAFPLANGTFQEVFVSTNGFVSLGHDDGAGCCSGTADGLASGAPRLAPFWTDLNPSASGDVFFNDLGDRAVITWKDVASFGDHGDSHTFQLQLFASGDVVFAYESIPAPHEFTTTVLVGLGPGGSPEAPAETDLSAAGSGTDGELTVYELIDPTVEQWDLGDASIRFRLLRVAPHVVTVGESEDLTGVDFGNFERTSIHGQAFRDTNGNGQRDADEPGLDGWTIQLFDEEGRAAGNTVTASADDESLSEAGLYAFENLGPGTYRIVQTPQPGWIQTFPTSAPAIKQPVVERSAISRGTPSIPGGANRWLLPDLIVDTENGLSDWFVEGDLIRFGQATPNIGAGPMELRGGRDLGDGTQLVMQRIYGNEGRFQDREAGRFEFHAEHGHVHFNDYTQYNLRAVLPDADGDGQPEVGDIVAGGSKTSFCLVDSAVYDDTLPNFSPDGSGFGCEDVQRISVGWEDIYDPYTEGQEIDISGVPRGAYWLEAIVDPDNHLQEVDETNNTGRVLVQISGVDPGAAGHTVTLTSGVDVDELDFGNFESVTLSGQKFWDVDGDGVRGDGDRPLDGWLIFIDSNRDGVLNNPVVGDGICDAFAVERCTRTDSDGVYRLDSVGPGTQPVREVAPANWRQTVGDYDVVTASGGDYTDLDFGNTKNVLTVADVRLNSHQKGRRTVRDIAISFSEALDATTATTRANYRVTLIGKDDRPGTADDRVVAVRAARYDAATSTVTLSTRKRLELGQFFRLMITSGGIADTHGGALDGDNDGAAGGNYIVILGIGASLVYIDRDGDQVALGLQGGGLMELLRSANGEAQRLRIVDAVPGSSVLSGGVVRSSDGDGRAAIAAITATAGVQNNLPSPPFSVGAVSAALVDSVLALEIPR